VADHRGPDRGDRVLRSAIVTERTRRKIHISLALFFAVQVPIAIWLQVAYPALFEVWWKQYLVFLSLYAIVSTHWAASAAETPHDEE
jgi:hypothetical protein